MKGQEGPAFKSEPGHRDSGEQLWTPGQVGQGWHEAGWALGVWKRQGLRGGTEWAREVENRLQNQFEACRLHLSCEVG